MTKKIEQIPEFYQWDRTAPLDVLENICKKINEIIEKINEKEEEENQL